MNKREKERLLKLADFLETEVPHEHFDMGDWGTGNFKQMKCGSAACALGWGSAVFPRSLKMVKDKHGLYDVIHTKSGRKNEEAGEEFFGLTPVQAYQMFMPDEGYNTIKDVVEHIRMVANAH